MRSITILGILALAFAAAPAKADPSNNTSENVFVIFDFGGFDTTDTNESFDFESTNLLILNLADVQGDIHGFLGLSFGNFGDLPDLTGVSYFILGHITGSDHLIIGSDGEPAPIPDGFETGIIDGIRNMDGLAAPLGAPGGMAFVTPGAFMGQFGVTVGTFVNPNSLVPFDAVASVGDDEGVVLNGFTDPIPLTTLILDTENGNFIATTVPEPGLSVLAILGVAGAIVARRRRRAA